MQRRSTTPTWRRPCLYYTCPRGGAAPRPVPVPLSRGPGEDATVSNRQPPRSASWWWTHSPMLSLVDSTRGHGRGSGAPRQRMPWGSWRETVRFLLIVEGRVPVDHAEGARCSASGTWPHVPCHCMAQRSGTGRHKLPCRAQQRRLRRGRGNSGQPGGWLASCARGR